MPFCVSFLCLYIWEFIDRQCIKIKVKGNLKIFKLPYSRFVFVTL